MKHYSGSYTLKKTISKFLRALNSNHFRRLSVKSKHRNFWMTFLTFPGDVGDFR